MKKGLNLYRILLLVEKLHFYSNYILSLSSFTCDLIDTYITKQIYN